LANQVFREFSRIEVPFAGGASHHQRARAQETGPQAADACDKSLRKTPSAGEEILVDDNIRLDRANGAAAFDREVAVSEFTLQRIFDQFVVTMILALAGES
jgi:hypothetical protein